MLIFLGDSQPLGYELGLEIGQGLDHVPENVMEKIHTNTYYMNEDCRPDLSYPELLSQKLNMDYVNLGMGGSSHIQQYDSFLKYIRKNDIPDNTSVFLNTTDKHRGMVVDVLDGNKVSYMPRDSGSFSGVLPDDASFASWFPSSQDDNENEFLQSLRKDRAHITDTMFRIFPWINVQMINLIAEMCNSRNWNFLFHQTSQDIWPLDYYQPGDSYFTLTADQILSDPVIYKGSEFWLDFHLSIKGHLRTTDLLYDRYLKWSA